MENYQKRPKSKRSRFEADNDDASTALQHSEGKPGAPTAGQPRGKGTPSSTSGGGKSDANTPRHGVMHISAHGKIRTYVSRGLEVLLESEQQSITASTSSTSSPTVVSSSSSSSQGPATTTTTTNDDDHDDASSPKGMNEKHKRNYSGAAGVLTIKAQGKNIPKAVTIVEILKRKLEGSLHQFTEIGQVTEEEVWDPKTTSLTSAAAAAGPAIASSSSAGSKQQQQQQQQQQLDPIRLVRHRPTIRIRLSRQLDIHRPPQADDESDGDEEAKEMMEAWPGAILDRDAAVRRLVGYQAPTGNDIYL
ncbi:hypothetical protein DFQ27_009144 [Actinomortierella ambigua]|uniref:DNA/RNA-binding protein Alba-like domain-containing protein n=1 Tax=Actinomortierella ambigua TaxID=1343610 RepID=A0A9P6QH88_9FUNG|nr:hypothetical protein DFQ27_009144 [Actinomortierella ambigua]